MWNFANKKNLKITTVSEFCVKLHLLCTVYCVICQLYSSDHKAAPFHTCFQHTMTESHSTHTLHTDKTLSDHPTITDKALVQDVL